MKTQPDKVRLGGTEGISVPRGRLLARNTVVNLAGQVLPLLAALPAVPYLVHRLGVDAFGVLSLAWTILNMSTALDLGLGRAVTKFVAEYLGQGRGDEIPALVWTSLAAQIPLGIGGGILVAASTPLLAEHLLRIPPRLVGETEAVFYLIAASLPLVLASSPLRGVLEAIQRFDLVNSARVPATALMFLVPAGAVAFGIRLPGIVTLLVVVRIGLTAAYLALCLRTLPVLRRKVFFRLAGKGMRSVFSYGGWVMISNVCAPLIQNMDRFLVGSLLSVAAVSFYTVPSEFARRTTVFSFGLYATLFPYFGWHGQEDPQLLSRMSAKACKVILAAMSPVAIVLIVFGRDILKIWLGANFARQSAVALQILVIAYLINGLSYVPYSAVLGLGRADWNAKVDLAEAGTIGLLLWVMIPRLGINGAALAVLGGTAIQFLSLFWLSGKLGASVLRSSSAPALQRTVLLCAGLAAGAIMLKALGLPVLWAAVTMLLMFAAFAYALWQVGSEEDERIALRAWAAKLTVKTRVVQRTTPPETASKSSPRSG